MPLAIDFCNPAPDAEAASVGQANFEWVVEAVSEMAIRKAREHVPGRDNLSWGKFVQAAVKRGASCRDVSHCRRRRPLCILSAALDAAQSGQVPRLTTQNDARVSQRIQLDSLG